MSRKDLTEAARAALSVEREDMTEADFASARAIADAVIAEGEAKMARAKEKRARKAAKRTLVVKPYDRAVGAPTARAITEVRYVRVADNGKTGSRHLGGSIERAPRS